MTDPLTLLHHIEGDLCDENELFSPFVGHSKSEFLVVSS